MEDKTKLLVFLVVLVLVGIPVLGNLAGKGNSASTAPATDSGKPGKSAAKPAPGTPPPPQQFAQAPQPMQQQPPPPPQQMPQRPQPQRPAAPPPPMDLTGTAWTLSTPQVGEVTVEFFAGGAAVAQGPNIPMRVQGTWQQNGNSVVLSAMGQTITAQLNGNQLMANGMAANRIR